jgi:hypothetical protein
LEVAAQFPAGAPGLPPLPAAITDRAALTAVASQAALIDEAIGWFAAVATARPLVLLLSDLHWADPATSSSGLAISRSSSRRSSSRQTVLCSSMSWW